jgi:hypothetical protein
VQTIVVNATPYPYASAPGSLDYHSVEVDRTGATSRSWVADAWSGDGVAQAGVTPYLYYGARIDDGYGDAFLYRYPAPLIVDRTPQTNGASWSNGGALALRENDRNGTTAEAVYAADGSYTERVRYPYACSFGYACVLNVTARAGGSARYSGSALNANGIASIAIGAPTSGTIAIDIGLSDGAVDRFGVPAWFAAGEPLYAESDWVHTNAMLPHACTLSKYAGSTANVVVRRIVRIDPAAGSSETQETQTYTTPRYGTICVAFSDQLLDYYDFGTADFSGTPIATARVFEVLSLTSERTGQGVAPASERDGAAAAALAAGLREAAAKPHLMTLRTLREIYKKAIAR